MEEQSPQGLNNKEISFVKQLIADQRAIVVNSNTPNSAASGLFGNDTFCRYIYYRYGQMYLRETRIEFKTDSKRSLLDQLDSWLEDISISER